MLTSKLLKPSCLVGQLERWLALSLKAATSNAKATTVMAFDKALATKRGSLGWAWSSPASILFGGLVFQTLCILRAPVGSRSFLWYSIPNTGSSFVRRTYEGLWPPGCKWKGYVTLGYLPAWCSTRTGGTAVSAVLKWWMGFFGFNDKLVADRILQWEGAETSYSLPDLPIAVSISFYLAHKVERWARPEVSCCCTCCCTRHVSFVVYSWIIHVSLVCVCGSTVVFYVLFDFWEVVKVRDIYLEVIAHFVSFEFCTVIRPEKLGKNTFVFVKVYGRSSESTLL